MRFIKSLILYFSILSLSSCAPLQSEKLWSNNKIEKIKSKIESFNNKTTYEEVIEKFGKPEHQSENPNYVAYNYKKLNYRSTWGIGVAPGAAFPVPTPDLYFNNYKFITLIIDFDDSWKYKTYEILW
jgi:hypothetical protein